MFKIKHLLIISTCCLFFACSILYFVPSTGFLQPADSSVEFRHINPTRMKLGSEASLDKTQLQSALDQPVISHRDLFGEFEVLAKASLPVALKKAKHLSGDDRVTAISSVFSVALVSDPDFVADEILNAGLSASQVKTVLFQLDMAWSSPIRGLKWVEQNLTGELRNESRSRLLRKLATVSPEEALMFLDSISPGADYNEAYTNIMLGWIELDPLGAVSYAQDSLEEPGFSAILSAIGPSWSERDPVSVRKFLEAHPNDTNTVGLTACLAVSLARTAPESTLKWTASMAGPAGEAAQRACIRELIQANPQNAAFVINSAEMEIQTQLAPKLVAAWSATDVVAAAEWVSSFPAKDQLSMVGPLLWNWINIDPQEALNWTQALESGALKEKALAYFTEMESQLSGSSVEKTVECQEIIRDALNEKLYWIQ